MDFDKLFKQIIHFSKNLNKKQKMVIAVSLVVFVSLLTALLVYNKSSSNNQDDGYRVLFNNLSQKDAALIVQELDKKQIPYKIPQDGVIEVPKDIVEKTRLDIAAIGLPKDNKVGFEIFDQQQFGMTDFEQNIKYLRALEGELSRTIKSIYAIDDAIVHIAIPKESLFVSEQVPPTASVVIKLKPNMILTPKQIKGIKNLVSSSVPKLQPQNVKLVNQYGDPLGEDDELTTDNELLKARLIYKNRYEKLLENKIVSVISPIVGGKEKVVARVSVDFDFSQVKSREEQYSPDNTVRSEQTEEIKRQGYAPKQVGGVPGVVSNIGPVQGIDSNNLKEKYSKSKTTTNYEISKVIKDIKGQVATIKRITAAVVVDGKYEYDKNTSNLKYIPLNKFELTSIENLVKMAIGYNPKRGDDVTVTNLQFNTLTHINESISPQAKMMKEIFSYLNPITPLLKWLVILIILFVMYKKIINPFMQKMLEIKTEEEEVKKKELVFEEEEENSFDKLQEMKKKVEQQLGINASNLNEEELKYEVLLERIKEIVEEKPEEVASLLNSLLANEDLSFKDKG